MPRKSKQETRYWKLNKQLQEELQIGHEKFKQYEQGLITFEQWDEETRIGEQIYDEMYQISYLINIKSPEVLKDQAEKLHKMIERVQPYAEHRQATEIISRVNHQLATLKDAVWLGILNRSDSNVINLDEYRSNTEEFLQSIGL